jgi:Ras-related protein Rab-1A
MKTVKNKENIKQYKIVIVGEHSSGKTSILLNFAENEFNNKTKSTIGVDMKARYIKIEENTIKLQIWDTAGQERFRSIIQTYYVNAEGIILVFDLNNKDSFDNLNYWMLEIENIKKKNCPIILVGNKCDIYKKVTNKDINNFITTYIQNFDITYIESSAKNNINIENIFIEISKKILNISNDLINSQILTKKESEDVDIKLFDNLIINKSSCCIIT